MKSTKTLNYYQMLSKLKKRFPNAIILDGFEFDKNTSKNISFWLKNSEQITYTKKDINCLYLANDYYNNKYELNIYKKFEKWCNKYGYYCSSASYTLQIFKI